MAADLGCVKSPVKIRSRMDTVPGSIEFAGEFEGNRTEFGPQRYRSSSNGGCRITRNGCRVLFRNQADYEDKTGFPDRLGQWEIMIERRPFARYHRKGCSRYRGQKACWK
jgi:hypothetical protein